MTQLFVLEMISYTLFQNQSQYQCQEQAEHYSILILLRLAPPLPTWQCPLLLHATKKTDQTLPTPLQWNQPPCVARIARLEMRPLNVWDGCNQFLHINGQGGLFVENRLGHDKSVLQGVLLLLLKEFTYSLVQKDPILHTQT